MEFPATLDIPFLKFVLKITFNSLSDKKAPMIDVMVFRLLKRHIENLRQLFTQWENLCLSHNSFLLFMREDEITSFLKLWNYTRLT